MTELGKQLTANGVALLNAAGLGVDPCPAALAQLQEVWNRLPADPHVPATPTTRRRRHARFQFDRGTRTLSRLPDGAYFQSSDDNQLYGGAPRKFDPIEPADLANNPDIERVIATCAAALPLSYSHLLIHCHLMRIVGLPEQPGEPSPEGVHRDGFDYVSLHMINRTNLEGGQSLVLSKKNLIVAAPMLLGVFDTLVMDDREFLHAALPFFVREGIGYRDMMLCSYQEKKEG